MFLETEIMAKLNEFVNSDKDKKFLREKGVYAGVTKDEAKIVANELKQMLIQSTAGICKSCAFLLDDYDIKVTPIRVLSDGRYKITLTVDKEALRRDSLLTRYGGKPIGSGVYDIIGLFTQGYTANKFVYGYWDSKSAYVRSHSLLNGSAGLQSHDFIDKAIEGFKLKYPHYQMEISYPALWHS